MTKTVGLSILAALALLVQSGNAGGPAVADSGKTLRIVVSQDVYSIEPALMRSFDGFQLMSATQLSLVTYADQRKGAGRRLVPYGAAQLPAVSRDRRTYVFRIRPRVQFSDGTAVTARNFVAGFERILKPSMNSPRAFLFQEVRGADAFESGKATHVSGLVARKGRLIVRLTAAAPDFLDRLALPTVTAMPLNLPVDPNGVDAPLPSAGPYYVKEYVPGRFARLVRNPYWKPSTLSTRRGYADEIEYRGRSWEEAALQVSNGDADVTTFPDTTRLAPDLLREFRRRYGRNRHQLWLRAWPGRVSLLFNLRRGIFAHNPRLRRAVNFALDRKELVNEHGPLAGEATDQLLLPGRPGFRDWKLYPFQSDLVAARRLARGARRGGEISFYVPWTASGPGVASVVKSNLERIGLRVDIVPQSSDSFAYNALVLKRGEPWDLALSPISAFRVDPIVFINYGLQGQRHAEAGPNLGGFDEPEWNRRMERAARATRGRRRAFALLDRDLMRSAAPVAPYFVGNALTLFSARVGCASWLSDGYPNLAGLCLN
jgi:ABC-type transport system substrate-binding protein